MTKNYDPAAWKTQKDDQLKQAQEAVLQIAENFHRDPTQIAEMLAFQSRFHSYSIRNSMLIYASNPHATFTASFAHFKSMGWSVQKGQKGTQILVPARVTYIQDGGKWVQLSKASKRLQAEYHEGKIPHKSVLRFKVGYVFDISQTDCPPEQYPKIFSMGQSSEDHKAAYKGLVEWSADKLKCPVSVKDIHSISLRGFYSPLKNTITLSDKLNDTQLFSTCLHEVTHAILHNSPDAMAKPTAQIEFEADALSVMLETHAGIELTEARKGHLADNYREMVSALPDEAKVDEILQPVAEIYKNMVGEIEAAITKYMDSQDVSLSENIPAEHEEAPVTAEGFADGERSSLWQLENENYITMERIAPEVFSGTYSNVRYECEVDELMVAKAGNTLVVSLYDRLEADPFYSPRIEFEVDDANKTLHPVSYEQTEPRVMYSVTNIDLARQLGEYCKNNLFPYLQNGYTPVEAVQDGQSISLRSDVPQIEAAPIMEM